MDTTHDDNINKPENGSSLNKNKMISQEKASTRISARKILDVTSDTVDIDANEIIAKLMQYANISDALAHVEKKLEYIVQIPLKHQDAFNAGEVFINQNSKTGVMWPTLYKSLDNGKRQFVDNLPIKQEELLKGSPFESIAVSYHNLYMQKQINDLAEIMNQTYHIVEQIEQGQKDDRIGLLLAGRDQFIFALNSDSENCTIAIEQSRSNMLIAQRQLLQTFKRRVNSFKPIPENGWKRFRTELFHNGSLRAKDKEFIEIQEYYALYLQATQMIAASYAICGDVKSAEQVFNIAENEMKRINFDALKTLQYIHKKNTEMFYYHADEYIATERDICLEDSKNYDTINIQVSGEQLLEVFENGRTKKISESNSGQ